ncbi:MAG: 23S rRNA (adenine(2503)-C(2))-methyltransferase RlmN [Alphaproteobacteria bacterium]|nr:23S rRNA (adenine(2503)-C(2))-methyltransferase RlmN [Alphaproteobacteria bacterium]
MNEYSTKKSILGTTLNELINEFSEKGFSKLDAKRVFPWIHPKLANSFDEMSDLPKDIREKLHTFFSLERPKCEILQESYDGAKKALLQFQDSKSVETVFIPEEKRNTICISSQVGCPIGCKFCNTGTQTFQRNLTSSEIMAQIIYWLEKQRQLKADPITNIVFMGMGEPILNAKNLFSTLEILLNKKTYNFSRHKITVSTSGIIDNSINELAKFGVKLAISLHASNDIQRSSLMPINNKYKISELLAAAKRYLNQSKTNHITFEYLLLANVNDSKESASQLYNLLKSFSNKCRVNLIVFNSWNGTKFQGSSKETANEFSKFLLSKGIRTIIRKSRGQDIMAACGQLKSEKIHENNN